MALNALTVQRPTGWTTPQWQHQTSYTRKIWFMDTALSLVREIIPVSEGGPGPQRHRYDGWLCFLAPGYQLAAVDRSAESIPSLRPGRTRAILARGLCRVRAKQGHSPARHSLPKN